MNWWLDGFQFILHPLIQLECSFWPRSSNLQMPWFWELVSISLYFLVFPSTFRSSSTNSFGWSLDGSSLSSVLVCVRPYADLNDYRWLFIMPEGEDKFLVKIQVNGSSGINQALCRITQQCSHHVLLFLFPQWWETSRDGILKAALYCVQCCCRFLPLPCVRSPFIVLIDAFRLYWRIDLSSLTSSFSLEPKVSRYSHHVFISWNIDATDRISSWFEMMDGELRNLPVSVVRFISVLKVHFRTRRLGCMFTKLSSIYKSFLTIFMN